MNRDAGVRQIMDESVKLPAFVICSDANSRVDVQRVIDRTGGIWVARTFDHYPDDNDLVRAIRVYAPEIIFVDLANMDCVNRMARLARLHIEGVQIVATHATCHPDLLLQVLRLGLQEFLSPSASDEEAQQCFARVRRLLAEKPTKVASSNLVYSFVPAKAGAGASTVAVNSASALAGLVDERVFLGDFDLNSGIVGFMLKMDCSYSVIDAVRCGMRLDDAQWRQIVQTRGKLDVVQAGHIELDTRIEPAEIRNFIESLRRSYKVVCADLSGNLEKFSLEIMRESKKIFVVATPELPMLHLAREKVRFIESIGLGDRAALVLNRYPKHHTMKIGEIESLVGVPVDVTISNDYGTLQTAIEKGVGVEPSTTLGKQYGELARAMLSGQINPKPTAQKRFLEYFAIVPMKYRPETVRNFW